MAGEIEEPFRFNFQADLLQSGSISFGRFESESLSWERRSIFSHNRHLEDVEKYSKPGSVTEKKAYFEAHFRRKALLKQNSSESQDGREFQTIENDDTEVLQDTDVSPYSSGHSKYDQETEIQKCVNEKFETLCSDNGNESGNVTSFDESISNLGDFSGAPDDESMTKNVDRKLEEKDQIRTENVVLVKNEETITSHTADKKDDIANSRSQQTFSSKVRPASGTKQPKPKLKGHTSSEVSNGFAKTKIRENKGLLMKEKEKQSTRPASPFPPSVRKTSKSEESSMSFLKAKTLPLNRSIMKESRLEKTKSSVVEKSLPVARQTVNRMKHTVTTPSKPHVNQSASGFTFKSDQRAERRKEEKRAAEITQSQKSLNFKATPMPSFYKESSRFSDQNKVITTNKTPNRPRTASMTPHANKYSSNSTTSSNPRPSSSTSLTNKTRPLEPSRRVHEKKNDSSSPKQKEPEPTKGPRARTTLRGSGPRLGYLAVSIAT